MGSKLIINNLFFFFLLLNFPKQSIPDYISILVVETHESKEPEPNINTVDEQEYLYHTFDHYSCEISWRNQKYYEYCHYLVDDCRWETDYEWNPDYLFQGSGHPVEKSQAVDWPGEDIWGECEDPDKDHEDGVLGVASKEEKEEGPDCAAGAIGEPLDPEEGHEEDHGREDKVERDIGEVVYVENLLGGALPWVLVVDGREDDDSDAHEDVEDVADGEYGAVVVLPGEFEDARAGADDDHA